ncbi:MAG: glycosyltransferase [Desulfobacter sp.]|uniref:glycosyltransferase n=1 Tax=Desulfobacter sp. TaxID=2294 RepID=UPI001B688AFB|nr:glycosyltransferase [Desulfobacter sp.]MBP8829663.1 glycosyltransferase [Desulfobacter sp.]
MMKIDLHVHSKFSKRPSQWILQKISCPESFTEPMLVYNTAKAKGMSLVTISDHNTIDGALEIAHLPDTYISEEITAYFPEDGCKVHVLAQNITEAHHNEIQKIRKNIFDLVAYLNAENILNIIAHPLYAVNDRLTINHFEQMLLLFKNFELNGARNDKQNQIVSQVLKQLTPMDIERLSNIYDYQPLFDTPWKKNLTGGSDDHSGLNIARTCTAVDNATNLDDFMAGILNGKSRAVSDPSSPQTMAHNLYGIAYQFYSSRFNLGRHTGKDQLLKFLDQSLMPVSNVDDGLISKLYTFFSKRKNRQETTQFVSIKDLIRRETERLFAENPDLMNIARIQSNKIRLGSSLEKQEQHREKLWFDFVNQLSNKVLSHTGDHLLGQASGANLFNIFQTIGSVGGLYSLLAPYFLAFVHFAKDNEINAAVLNRFAGYKNGIQAPKSRVKLGHFTDTFYDVNGVAQTLQQQVQAALKNDKHLTIITCDAQTGRTGNGVKNFTPMGVYEIPEYTEQKMYYPPFLEMLDYCYQQGFTHIHSATPGPIGLAALAISKILKLPLSSTYHTQFPQYAQYLTGDDFIEGLTWKFMIWYYDQMDQIYVSSQNSFDELTERGIKAEKIRIMPRGINTEIFHPSKRCDILTSNFGVNEDALKFLYVGRVSREKNLPLLVDAFKTLYATNDKVHLTVVGDGPYADEMKGMLKNYPVTFTGYLSGEPLCRVYASADIFVFPSTTDTFGNVVLEAQASGLPVIVSDLGGPCENMLDRKTGIIVKSDDSTALLSAMQEFVITPGLCPQMSRRAREYMENRSFENAFIQSWEFYKEMETPVSMEKFLKAV